MLLFLSIKKPFIYLVCTYGRNLRPHEFQDDYHTYLEVGSMHCTSIVHELRLKMHTVAYLVYSNGLKFNVLWSVSTPRITVRL
jgi:hypothetical protein